MTMKLLCLIIQTLLGLDLEYLSEKTNRSFFDLRKISAML